MVKNNLMSSILNHHFKEKEKRTLAMLSPANGDDKIVKFF
jgi:hypothetical protein